MKWESVNAISTAVAAIATVLSTIIALFSAIIAFQQWSDAKKSKQSNELLTQRLAKSLTPQQLGNIFHNLTEDIKDIKTKLPEDKQFLNKQIAYFENEIEKFQTDLKIYKEAGLWLLSSNTRKHLAKNLGDEAIETCSLKLSKDKRFQFYKDIYKYLTLLYYTLNYGVPMPEELITKSLHKKQYYEIALNFIFKRIPKNLSDGAVKLIEKHLNDLIDNLS